MINSRRKGKTGELELAHLLTEAGFPARRGQQIKGTQDSPDIEFLDPSLGKRLYVECKRRQSLNLHKTMAIAVSESGEGQTPVIMHRRNSEDWLMTVRLSDGLKMLEAFIALYRGPV